MARLPSLLRHALAVESCDLDSSDETHLNIRVRFNQPVEPSALDRAASTVDVERSTALPLACLSRTAAEELILRVERPRSGRVRLKLDDSLVGSGAARGLEGAFSAILESDAPFVVERVSAWASTFQKLQEVRINFNRTLKQDQAAPSVRFEPAVEDVRCDIEWDDVRVRGKFACGRKYKAVVSAGLQDEHGKALEKDQVISFDVPDRSEAIRFPIRKGVLSPAGNLLLDLEVVNCANIDLSVSRLHENNLVAHLRGSDAEATSREVAEKSVSVKALHNVPTTVSVDLKELLGRPAGIYHIAARSHEDRWTKSESIVAVTDIGLSCKRERDGLLVWVTSVRTAKPLAGATVNLLTYNNQTLAMGATGADGCARVSMPKTLPDGAPYVVVAKLEGDISYCVLDSRTWVPDGIDLSGRSPTAAHDVMLYPERGVYRPGDVIHLTGVIRKSDGTTPSAFPIWIRTQRPDGKEAGAETVMPRPENQGMFHVEVHTREDDQMGPYRFRATLPGSEEVLGETSALVEAFLPIRIEMSAESTKARYVDRETPMVKVDGAYLFGKPAAGVDVAVSGTFREKRFTSKEYAEFTFGPLEIQGEAKLEEAKDALDSSGHCVVKLNAPPAKKPGVWQGRAVVTLTEVGSRSVSKTVEFEHQTALRHLGLRLAAGEVVAMNSDLELKWVQLDGDSEPAETRPFELAVEKIEHDWVIREVDGQMTWKTVERRTPALKKRSVNLDALQSSGSTTFTVDDPGEFVITAAEPDSGGKTELKFHVFDPDEGGSWAISDHPERIGLTLSGKACEPGTLAECLVQAPFAGQLLLTVEDDRVREYKVVEISSSPATVEIFVPTTLRGDAFVTATLVRPVDPERKKWLPNSARGIARLPIKKASRALPVELVGPANLGSRECAKISVQTGIGDFERPPVVHVWAVDDGILLSTGYQSPDPLHHYFGPRALDVESTDMFASLMPDVARPASMLKIGADGDDDGMDLRRNPVPSKRREPAVVWLASRPTDANGRAAFEVQMSEMSGRMRVMAVAVEGDRYGSASSDVTVTSPLMVEAGWPRVLAPVDRCRVPLKLFNNTDEVLRVTLSASTKGARSSHCPTMAN
ncbi:MAG: hypothetical protein IPK83_04475 [Planctomycetes bacterium]|nr:hypothetical protein [Planctomycetota bacterium]